MDVGKLCRTTLNPRVFIFMFRLRFSRFLFILRALMPAIPNNWYQSQVVDLGNERLKSKSMGKCFWLNTDFVVGTMVGEGRIIKLDDFVAESTD